MIAATRHFVPVLPQRRSGAGLVPRWLLVAGAVGLMGVNIDLFRGSPASAVQVPAAPVPATAAPHLDHAVVRSLADEQRLEPGASIAAYDVPASEAPVPAAAVTPPMADDAMEPGASIAAYER